MLFRQLEYFVAVAREQHFARAAEACYVSQPALSASIAKLERELNVTLINRGHNYRGADLRRRTARRMGQADTRRTGGVQGRGGRRSVGHHRDAAAGDGAHGFDDPGPSRGRVLRGPPVRPGCTLTPDCRRQN